MISLKHGTMKTQNEFTHQTIDVRDQQERTNDLKSLRNRRFRKIGALTFLVPTAATFVIKADAIGMPND